MSAEVLRRVVCCGLGAEHNEIDVINAWTSMNVINILQTYCYYTWTRSVPFVRDYEMTFVLLRPVELNEERDLVHDLL
jgi:hypothetical protein